MTLLAALLAVPVTALAVRALLGSERARTRFGAAPREDRWHTQVTPAFGGIAIFAGLAVALVAALVFGGLGSPRDIAAVLVAATVVFAFGLLDDLHGLPPLAKLAAQLVAALIVLSSGISVEVVSNDALGWVLGVLWIVGLTNAFNLLDNMDGLAASLAAVAAGCFAVSAAWVSPNADVALLAAALAGACLSFLPWNFRPRRPAALFMGDSGSQVLGLVLAACGLMASYEVAGTTVATVVLPLLVLAVPLFDTALVTAMRVAERRPVSQGGRDHTSHRLVYSGLTEKRAVILLVAVSAALGGTSLAYQVLDSGRITAVGVLVTFALLVELALFLADAAGEQPATVRPLARHARPLAELAVDAALVSAAFYAAYVLVIDGNGTPWQRHVFLVALPFMLAARHAALFALGLYRPTRRRESLREGGLAALAVLGSSAVAVGLVAATTTLGAFPLTVFAVDAVLAALLVGAGRSAEQALVVALGLFRGAQVPHGTPTETEPR